MKPKYKMTGCARFFIFLLIAVPAAYFGSLAFHGNADFSSIKERISIQNIKEMFKDEPNVTKESNEVETVSLESYEKLVQTIDDLQNRVSQLERDLTQKDKEIAELKLQINPVAQ